MRTFLVLICSLALACAAGGAQKEDKSKKQAPKKKQAQATQHAAAPSVGPQQATPKHVGAASRGSQHVYHPSVIRQYPTTYHGKAKTKGSQQITAHGGSQKAKEKSPSIRESTYGSEYHHAGVQSGVKTKGKMKGSQQIATQQSAYYDVQKTKKLKRTTTSAGAFESSTKTYKAKHFNLQTKTHPATVGGVTFQQNRHIQGSQNWQGKNYWAFRNYRPLWHERNWWNSHYNRVVFVYGGWYYWNAGWWYPAWGYAPNAYYAYDGPIYAYNNLPPDQVIANVQAALQEQGYYHGDVDGLLGPLTRAAIANYQRDHGLYMTSAIDRPTLESLGMA
jgi:hypothetical protein